MGHATLGLRADKGRTHPASPPILPGAPMFNDSPAHKHPRPSQSLEILSAGSALAASGGSSGGSAALLAAMLKT
ncbi:hypothetical protein [Rhodococcus sp. IEGM 1379]|uniref:hypothetical protein n=1 Tax=Rhodococcus sp. IEGM 1379 TaxID=3047086 RepID=UPI0024B7AB52|nr:hypothetical protein [Rhodococcus sp. IEGM 1379]MDI9918749.1 hypothetical protein [Rhodococcus sp. IEGM 1379]